MRSAKGTLLGSRSTARENKDVSGALFFTGHCERSAIHRKDESDSRAQGLQSILYTATHVDRTSRWPRHDLTADHGAAIGRGVHSPE